LSARPGEYSLVGGRKRKGSITKRRGGSSVRGEHPKVPEMVHTIEGKKLTCPTEKNTRKGRKKKRSANEKKGKAFKGKNEKSVRGGWEVGSQTRYGGGGPKTQEKREKKGGNLKGSEKIPVI